MNATATDDRIHRFWEGIDINRTGSHERDCIECAVTALTNIGYDNFDRGLFNGFSCDGDGKRVYVAVLPIAVEDYEFTIEDLHGVIDDEVAEIGASICDVSGCDRFDVVSVCINAAVRRVRIHHVRSVWER